MSIIVNNIGLGVTGFIGRAINAPEQRLIQGATGVFLQPMIDVKNKSVDKETRAVSLAKTVGKVIAGTLTGVLIRYAGIAIAKNFAQYKIAQTTSGYVKKVIPKRKIDFLMPTISFETAQLSRRNFEQKHNNYVKMFGTLIATFTMLFTNFYLDGPITQALIKKLMPWSKNYIEKLEARNVSV